MTETEKKDSNTIESIKKEQNRYCTFDLAIDQSDQSSQIIPPKEFRILKAGINTSITNGDVVFDEIAAQNVMQFCAKHNGSNPIVLDYAHGTTKDKASAQDGIAAGWLNLELRLDNVNQSELWAVNVDYTQSAFSQIQAKEWKYISPTLFTDKDNRAMGIVAVALTNIPALDLLEPLFYEANMGNETPINAAESETEKPAEMEMDSDQIKSLSLQLVEYQTAIAAKDVAIKEYEATINEYSAKIAKHEATIKEYELASLDAKIKSAIEEGEKQFKIVPAMKSTLTELGKTNFDLLERHIESLPKIKALAAKPINQANQINATKDEWAKMNADEKLKLAIENPEQFNAICPPHMILK